MSDNLDIFDEELEIDYLEDEDPIDAFFLEGDEFYLEDEYYSQATTPFVTDEQKRVVRPVGQSEAQSTKYGFAGWVGDVQTLVAGSVIQPYGMCIPLSATSAITLTANPTIADGVAGQILILKGTSNTNTITLTDGTGMQMAGNMTLGVNDTISFIFDGTDWIEIARSNN